MITSQQGITTLLMKIFVLVLVGTVAVNAKKIDRNSPHEHRGKLKPYQPGPFTNIKLTSKDENKLQSGHAVMKQSTGATAGGAICVQDVNAPISAVWYQILDMDNYTKKVSKLNLFKNYQVSKHRDGTTTIKTKQILGVLPGYSYESYYDHTFYPKKSSLTWTLDYDKTSDFDDVAGHWHVMELPTGQSRVYYACDIQMKGTVPGPIMNYISKAALKQATAWVKKESEANPTKTIPTQYGHVPTSGKTPTPTTTSMMPTKPAAPKWRFWGCKKQVAPPVAN